MILNHLGVVVSNLTKSEDFYCRALGCTLSGRWQNDELKAVNLQCAGLTIELLEYVSPSQTYTPAGVINHLAFKVQDIEAQIERLNKLGAAFETVSPKIIASNKKIIFFHGPDGERIELVEEN
ncbi:MAG: VOC family protein [Syntrophomonadaceae bacterium]|nr:VOC family protein [Syntrophomonadaceae bacterium]